MDKLTIGRPYGGCAILWDSKFNGKVEPIKFQSTRLCGVAVKLGNWTLLIANVYMPTDTAHDRRNDNEFNGILQEIIDMKDGLG